MAFYSIVFYSILKLSTSEEQFIEDATTADGISLFSNAIIIVLYYFLFNYEESSQTMGLEDRRSPMWTSSSINEAFRKLGK